MCKACEASVGMSKFEKVGRDVPRNRTDLGDNLIDLIGNIPTISKCYMSLQVYNRSLDKVRGRV